MKETVLWTNPDTTQDFGTTTVTFPGDSLDNYDYVKLKCQYNKSTPDTTLELIYSIDEFKKLSTGGGFVGQIGLYASPYFYTRYFWYSADRFLFGPCYRWNANNSGTTTNNIAIPVTIIGIKA